MRDEHHREIAPYALRNRQACSLDIENPRLFSASIGERKNWERSDTDGTKKNHRSARARAQCG